MTCCRTQLIKIHLNMILFLLYLIIHKSFRENWKSKPKKYVECFLISVSIYLLFIYLFKLFIDCIFVITYILKAFFYEKPHKRCRMGALKWTAPYADTAADLPALNVGQLSYKHPVKFKGLRLWRCYAKPTAFPEVGDPIFNHSAFPE